MCSKLLSSQLIRLHGQIIKPMRIYYWDIDLLSFYLPGNHLLKFERIWNTFKIKHSLSKRLKNLTMCPTRRRVRVLSKQLLLQFVCQCHENDILWSPSTVWFMGVNDFFNLVRLGMWLEQSNWSFEAVTYVFKLSGWSKVKPVIITSFSPDTGNRGAVLKSQATANLLC